MPARTNDFQRLVTFLERQLAPTGASVTPSALLTTTNGTEQRELDILIEHSVGSHPVRIALECRAHKRKQGVEWIEALRGKYEHLPVHKLIAVSKSGFTRSAERAATHLNITTVTLQRALSSDWPEEVGRYRVGLIVWNHPIRAAEVNYRDGPKVEMTSAELLVARIQDGQGSDLGSFTDDVKYLFTTFVAEDVKKWAQENSQEIFKEPPGYTWDLRITYTAHNRYLQPPHGPRRHIHEVILCLCCSYRFEVADMRYFRYQGSLLGSGLLDRPGDPNRYTFSVLYTPTGSPQAMNLHWEPRLLPGQDAVSRKREADTGEGEDLTSVSGLGGLDD